MSRTCAGRMLWTGALVGAALVGISAPSHAARYSGSFDPVYGAPFTNPDIFWSGNIDVTTSDSCASNAGTELSTFLSGTCEMVINSASVTFSTVVVGSPPTAGTLIETLNFTGGVVASMTFNDTEAGPPANPGVKQLTAVKTFPLNTVQSTKPELQFPQGGSGTQAYFSLAFLGSTAQLYWFENDPGPAAVVTPPSNLTTNLNAFNPCQATYNMELNCGWSSAVAGSGSGAEIIFTPVPEPEAYGLALAGASVVGFAMMRRRRQPASASA